MKSRGLTESYLTALEMTSGLERAVDHNFRRLFETAKNEWEQRFAGNDPSDACVSVKITTGEVQTSRAPVRGSGFVKSAKDSLPAKAKLPLPRFAH
jgi:hypothetical protein